ncbi:hypothetical protein KP509_14G020700 [Ceratopteris richardii]|uniref:Uncharacterized protein n=1 Tax=Ceratopteris richardii TaxID=49495 RepID=A0A8T2T7Z5_CERRI|nr:hypothetical protein KP509_14G020700 [Ceratopteris richardii]
MLRLWTDAVQKSEDALVRSGCKSWCHFLRSSSLRNRSELSIILVDDGETVPDLFEIFSSTPTVKWGVNSLLIRISAASDFVAALCAVASVPRLDRLGLLVRHCFLGEHRTWECVLDLPTIEDAVTSWGVNASPQRYIEEILGSGTGGCMTAIALGLRHVIRSIRTPLLAFEFPYPLQYAANSARNQNFATLLLKDLTENTFLTDFYFFQRYGRQPSKIWGILISSHPSLISFYFWTNFSIFGAELNDILDSLPISSEFTSITLRCPEFVLCSVPRILDALRQCHTFHDLRLIGSPLQGHPSIAAQLARNKKNADLQYLSKASERPSALRVYLCGLPFSGKTTISKSLANCCDAKSRRMFGKFQKFSTSSHQVSRTRGIEVTVMQKRQDDSIRIIVWDLAGQPEFHAFHDSMLPDMGDLAISPLFLFVWSPFDLDNSGDVCVDQNGRRKMKSKDEFKHDLKYWLRFVTSKASPSERFKPKIFVAITRKDLLPKENMSLWLKSDLEMVQNEFKDYIEVDIKEGVFEIDARDSKSIASLNSRIFSVAKTILDDAPLEISICKKTRVFLQNLMDRHQLPPIMYKEELQRLFCNENPVFESQIIFDAFARCLVASGDILFYTSADLVVLDVQWFCNKVMGHLLYFNVKSDLIDCSDGFFNRHHLEAMLETHMKKVNRPSGFMRKQIPARKLEGTLLSQLLIALKLACPVDYQNEDSKLFIPISLSGNKRGSAILESHHLRLDEGSLIVGRRLSLKDKLRTFFTPGVFPLLQVTFYNHFMPQEIHVKLAQDSISFAWDGAEVLIEFCRVEGFDYFIDVLLSFQNKELDEALKWMNEKVLLKMGEVFADSRGIPGAEIMYDVIQPACIKSSAVANARIVVSVDRLTRILRQELERRETKIMDDGCINVLYTWQTRPAIHEPIQNLLGSAEVMKVVEEHEGFLRTAAADFLHADRIEDENIDIGSSQPESSSAIRDDAGKPRFGKTPSSKERESMYCALNAKMDKHFQRLDRRLESMERDLKTMMNRIEDLRSTVLSGLEKSFRFLEETEAGRLPRIFVLAEDDGIVRTLVTKITRNLQRYRLHLLCECPNEPLHIVEGDYGLKITALDDGLLKRGLPYLKLLLKIAFLAVTTSAHIACGAGNIVPDFTKVLSNIVDPPSSAGYQASSCLAEMAADTVESMMPSVTFEDTSKLPTSYNFQEGQQWLRDVLNRHRCLSGEDIYRTFGLRRIRCSNKRVTWVCDAHYSRGTPYPA